MSTEHAAESVLAELDDIARSVDYWADEYVAAHLKDLADDVRKVRQAVTELIDGGADDRRSL